MCLFVSVCVWFTLSESILHSLCLTDSRQEHVVEEESDEDDKEDESARRATSGEHVGTPAVKVGEVRVQHL